MADDSKNTGKSLLVSQLEQRILDQNAKLASMQNQLEQIQKENALLDQGVGRQWTDKALLGALNETNPEEGCLGAVMVILRRSIDEAHEEAQTHERTGHPERSISCVAGARRLDDFRQRLLDLWRTSHGGGPVQPKPRGYGSGD